jgi:hypothetical protein
MKETIGAIVNASVKPLSIIVVGVGQVAPSCWLCASTWFCC